jgi:hypothetical protein
MKKKQLINEIMGVPKAVDDWVGYFTAITTVLVKEIVKRDEWEAREFNYKGEDHAMYSQQTVTRGKHITDLILEIRGEDLVTFLDSKTFQDFPLYNPEIEVKLSFFPDEVFESEGMSDRMGATHTYTGSIMDVKLGKLGRRTIFSKNKFIFDINLPFSYIESHSDKHDEMLFKMLAPTVGHELTHAYQTYRQLLGGKTSIGFGKETILNMLPQNMKFQETPSWNYFLHLVYLHLSFEANARVTELYYYMKGRKVKNQFEAMEVLNRSESWKDYKELKSFNAEEFLSNFQAELHNDDPLHNLFMMFMPKDKRPPKLPSSNEEWLELLINRWDKMIQDGQSTLDDMGIDIPVMERVPQKAKDNPIEFFKFFERRFHKKAENLRRKLTRVVSLVLQEAEEKKQKAS